MIKDIDICKSIYLYKYSTKIEFNEFKEFNPCTFITEGERLVFSIKKHLRWIEVAAQPLRSNGVWKHGTTQSQEEDDSPLIKDFIRNYR